MKSWPLYKAGIEYQFLRFFNSIFQPLELMYNIDSPGEVLNEFPPIFIVGSPRSGTTVLYQLLCKHFNVKYIPNFISMCYRFPIVAARFYRDIFKNESEVLLSSSFGITERLSGPSEFAEFWYRWFPRNPQSITEIELSDNKIHEMQNEIAGLSKLYDAPIVFKNVVNSVRLIPLGTLFLSALFIEITRDVLDTAQSILRAREKLYRSKNNWWSVKTTNCETIMKEPYWIQIPKQIFEVEQAIKLAKDKLGKERFFSVSYLELCKDTAGQLEKIEDYLSTKNKRIKQLSLPEKNLFYSTGKRVSDSDYQLMTKSISELWN